MLREFKYFDRQIVVDFLSSVEGGLAKESKASYIQKSGQLGGKAGFPGFEVGGEKGHKEISIEESKSMEDTALFQRLYEVLTDQKMINKVDLSKEGFLQNIKQGQILEICGRIEMPFLEIVLDIFSQLLPIMQQFSPQGMDQKTLAAFKMLNQLSSLSTLNVRIISAQKGEVNFVATIYREKLKVSKQELADEYFALCRVRRILKEGEAFDLFKLPIKMNNKMIEEFLQRFDNIPLEALALLGKKPTIEDLQIRYPAIILNPIAIYQ